MSLCIAVAVLSMFGMDVDLLTANLHVETGMAYLDQGLPDKALGEFNTALEISEDAFEAHLGLARVAVINSSWNTAEEQYSLYICLQPDDCRAPLEMARMLNTTGSSPGDAMNYAEDALALDPLNGQCWLVLAESESNAGNAEQAIAWYTRTIIEKEELADEARVRMGMLHFDQGELADARELLLPAANAGREEAHHLLALIYLEQHDDLRARDSINRYLYLAPNGNWADSARIYLEELSSGNPMIN